MGRRKDIVPKMHRFTNRFHKLIEAIQKVKPELVGKNVDVRKEYGILRSLQRGTTAKALEAEVTPDRIEMNNFWQKVEASRGKAVSLNICQYYMEIR